MRSNSILNKLSFSSRGFRLWGILFLAAGMVGQGIVQNRLLDLEGLTSQEITMALEADPQVLKYMTITLLLQGLEAMAAPIFAMLLVEGFENTSGLKAYILRVLGLAVVSEIPFNLMSSGKLFDLSSRNPVFALVFCLVMMMFYEYYADGTAKSVLIRVMFTLGAAGWIAILRVQHGLPLLIMVAVLYFFRESRKKQVIFGIIAGLLCAFLSGPYIASPVAMLALLLYNGERGRAENKWANYLAYPVVTLAVGIAALFIPK